MENLAKGDELEAGKINFSRGQDRLEKNGV